MQRYFFHIYNDCDTPDEEGLELPDDETAVARGTAEARNLAAESVVLHGHLVLSHRIEVVSESGGCVAVIRFGDAVTIRQ